MNYTAQVAADHMASLQRAAAAHRLRRAAAPENVADARRTVRTAPARRLLWLHMMREHRTRPGGIAPLDAG